MIVPRQNPIYLCFCQIYSDGGKGRVGIKNQMIFGKLDLFRVYGINPADLVLSFRGVMPMRQKLDRASSVTGREEVFRNSVGQYT